MTFKAMKDKMRDDLGCTESAARLYLKIFRKRFGNGHREAVQAVSAEYDEDCAVVLTMTLVNGKQKEVKL